MDETREPRWWSFELVFSGHARKRMSDRGIGELEVRTILVGAIRLSADVQPRRIRVTGGLSAIEWTIVLEPDPEHARLVVVTAFRKD